MGDMITITADEYRRLCAAAEDLADLRSYDLATARIAAGQDELVPADVANRLFAGESPVRVWREFRGMTQVALATASGVNRVQITNIEAGLKTGSVDTVKKLADALGISLDDMV